MHQVIAFAVSHAALMSESEQTARNFTNKVIDNSIAGHGSPVAWAKSRTCRQMDLVGRANSA
jgi:hypothetical protein